MNEEVMVEQLFQSLISGDRSAARSIVQEAVDTGVSPENLATDVYWPTMEMVSTLFRADQLTTLAHHYASRMLHTLVSQLQPSYETKPSRGLRVLMFSGPGETDELAGRLVADLAEADGYEVFCGGGGVANDEILEEVGNRRPDILLMFASAPTDAPNIRLLIDKIRSVGACPGMQIVVGGGVFNRAEGLAEEIGADLWAKSPAELLGKLSSERHRRASADQRTVGRNRRTQSNTAAA